MSGAVPDMYVYTLYLSYTVVTMHVSGTLLHRGLGVRSPECM